VIVQKRRVLSDKIIINSSFGPSAIVGRGFTQSIALSQFGVTTLKDAKYGVELALKVDSEKLKIGLINPETLNRIVNQQVSSSFEASL